MRRGTTPTIWVSLPCDIEEIAEIWLTVSQRSREILTRSKSTMRVEEDVRRVSWQLTQAETLKLDEGCKAMIQVRMRLVGDDDEYAEALATNIATVKVEGILKGGVI